MDPIIHVQNLTKKFGDFTAVNGISLEVAKGAICAVLGVAYVAVAVPAQGEVLISSPPHR